MRYRIKTHQDFDKEFKRLCKKYSSLKADLSALGKSLSENPDQGTSLGKGVRKVRMAIASKGKGKSHGARVITYTEAIVCADNRVRLFSSRSTIRPTVTPFRQPRSMNC